jgi:hypothetical protein
MMAAREGWPYSSSGRPQGPPQPGEHDAARRDAEECQILNPARRIKCGSFSFHSSKIQRRVLPHGIDSTHRVMSFHRKTATGLPSKNKIETMHLLFSPVLGSAIIIGGGVGGLLLVVIIVVLLVR